MLKVFKKIIPFEYRIPLIYIVIGALWILFSDEFVLQLTDDPHRIQILSTYKGWFYVIVTGIMLYYHIQKEIKRRTILYDELLETKKKAVESDNLKTAFLSNLSHYVRTPMNGILGFVNLLQDKNTSPEKQELFLGYVNERSQNLLQTLNSIIEISKIQEGQSELSNDSFHINSLLRSITSAENLDLTQIKRDISIKISLGLNDGDDELFSDKAKIIQILSCLLNNAIKFTEQGDIEIGYSINSNAYVFFVKDSGKGIPIEKREMLFQDFMRNSAYIHTEGEGAGLGLYLSYGLTNLLGGSIFCLSIPKGLNK
jgi:signal transduction histidine kinase